MRTRIALVCTVWGAEFTQFFCEYSVATLLSPTSLPRAVAAYDFTLLLYTLEEDLVRMRAHSNFRKLATLVNVKPILLETLPLGSRRGHWVQWHHALLGANEFSSFILLIPDCLYANDAIERIADSLETNDIIYYCIPQVCLEPLRPYLDEAAKPVNGDSPYSYLDFTKLDIASLFVKFINPRYAVALHSPDYFVTHPEYGLRPIKGRIELHELACQALAVSSRATSVSYTLNSPTETAKTAFLEVLAIGVEYTFKYFEQYFRWPSSRMQLSRFSTLASWSRTFFEPGAAEYSKTQIEIAVAGLEAAAQRRTPVQNPRFKYARTAIEYYAAMYAIYDGPARHSPREVRRAIALAMSLPGFRSAIMSDDGSMTVFLPTSKGASQILKLLYRLGNPKHVLWFVLMHVIPGRLMLKFGQSFVLEQAAGRPAYRPRLRVIDPALAHVFSNAVTGRIVSLPTYISDRLVAYSAPIQYGPADDFVQRLIERGSSD
jgi:hypothetical protein